MWSMVMQVIEEVIKAILSELVSWMITLWLPALAASVISFGGSVAAAMTASIAKAASAMTKVTKHLGKFGQLIDKFMGFLVRMSGQMETLTRKFRVGLMPGERKFALGEFGVGKAAEGFKPSARVATTLFGGDAATLATGLASKAGIAAGTTAGSELFDAATPEQEEPWLNKSEIGGGWTPEQTRGNLDI
ncbi:hypothetical protein [Saccharomonospora sp. CUA-673]|uniref:hypothetical protein n=1 Tax=Saccharomonospora sp. CUA-673 TaxID=1904969 RepID=UPI002100AD8D|nr:hypothetical protein [Saccharomonospora sp. CUA-673]